MAGGTLLLTSQDAISKWLTSDYHVGEIFFYRGLWAYLPLAWLVWRSGGVSALRARQPEFNILRGVLNTAAGVMIVVSLGVMPVADVFAIVFLSPLIMTALAPVALGEAVGWRRWGAVCLGFAGVLIMLRPARETFGLIVLLPLAVAFVMASRDILTRRIGSQDDSVTILFYSVTASFVFGAATLPFGARWPAAEHWPIFVVAGFMHTLAHYLLIRAFQLAVVPVVAPYRYLSLVWAVGIGYVVWGDVPDRWIVTGAVLIVGAGLYSLYREARA